MEEYKNQFTTPGSRNWLKGSVAVNVSKRGLAPFACKVCDDIRVEQLTLAIKQLFPDLCENCSIVEVIPCDPNNNICNSGQCRFHKGRIFRPCPKVKCNDYRNTVIDKINKGIDIGCHCNSCRTAEIVPCNPRNTKQYIPTRPCPNNICGTLRNSIEQKHRFGNPSWKNTDARKWCVNAWDIAKCFMPPDGYAEVDNETDTDLNGIISVYINCEEFQQYFTADLSNRQNICDKVRDVGKNIRHAPGLEVTDDDLNVWLSDLKALFSDPAFSKGNPLAKDALNQLYQLENDELIIERSEVVAAITDSVDYLRRLTTASLETDNRIHDLEMKMEEVLKQNVISGMDSFKSELKDTLIKYHREHNCTLMIGPFVECGNDGLEDFYVPPNISRVILQSREKNKPLKEPLTSLDQLLISKQIIVLTADAGLGKTSFCKFLVVLWCAVKEGMTDFIAKLSDTQNFFSEIECLDKFTYLFYIQLRGNQCNTLEDIIFSHTKSVHTELSRDNKAFGELLSNENGLFILDGLDECDIPSLMPLAANRKYSILITSRPWKLASINMPSESTYTHAQVDIMNPEVSEKLVLHSNNCLNTHFSTSYNVDDFLSIIKNQHLESHLQNPMLTLQLLCVYHDKRSENKTCQDNVTGDSPCTEYDATAVSDKKDLTYLGKTRSHIYANMLELMLRSVEKKEESLVQGLSELYKKNGQTYTLPKCFDERNYTCSDLAELINDIGKLAAFSLLDDTKYVIEEHQIRKLKKEETTVLLKSGLLSKTSLKTLSEESNTYTFLHQTYKEMLACVFLSSQDFESDVWKNFIKKFESVMSPDILSFLCVMNYEQGCKCLDIFNKKKRFFYWDGIYYTSELKDYQSTIEMAHKECFNNGIGKPQITLKHALLKSDFVMEPDNEHLQKSALDLETIFIIKYTFTTAMHPKILPASLVILYVKDTTFRDDHIDLSNCTHLINILIEDTRLSHVTINPSSLEIFWVYVKPELIQEIPPMKVSFVGGSQFSGSLHELSLVNVNMDVTLDLSNCQNLQNLLIDDISYETLIENNVVNNIHRCYALQELNRDTLTFPADTHLDLSSLKHLSKINIQNSRLTHVTINPSSLETFWVYVKPELIPGIPPMKVSFVGGSQFSGSLHELSLVNVNMDVTLDLSNCQNLQNLVIENISYETLIENNVVNNIQRCYALQKLKLYTLTFPADTHLDLSSLKHLSKIFIQNSRLTHVTINPTSLEKFWVYVKPELIPEIPPMKVSFVGGSQFSGSLQELSLGHVTMDVTLDLSNCQNLQNLVIDDISYETLIENNVVNSIQRCYALQKLKPFTLTFPTDTHLDLSSLKHLSKINIHGSRLSHVTIYPTLLERFWVYVKPELIPEIPPMKVSFVGGSQFSGSLQELSLVHVTMDVTLDLSNCQNLQNLVIGNISYETLIENKVVNNIQRCYALQKLKLFTLTFPTDTHLELSSLKHLSKITIENSRLSHVTIHPTSLEMFWVYMKPELIPEIPPMKVSFVGGSQFSGSLQELSLVHVTMDVTLDLSNCQNLQNLVIENISYETLIENNVVNNIQRCYALQKLRLDTLTFPADTHLDLSSLKHLSKINIQNSRLTHVTINPSSLEKFWVYVKPELIQEIPSMEVSFVGGSQFSGSLHELSLVHITMDVTLDLSNCQNLQNLVTDNISYETLIENNVVNNIQRCYALQELRLNTLTFPADTHLDLSSLKHLSKITIQNSRLSHVTIHPTSLEMFWVYMKPELIPGIPPMKVSFVGGSQFSGSLRDLSLVHVTMDDTLDLSNYTHLELSSLKHLSKITIQNSRLSHVTIHPTSLEMFWVYMKPELIPEIPPMKVSFVGGSQFSGSLQELNTHLDLSSLKHLSNITIQNSRLSHVTIHPTSLEMFWVYMKPELIPEIPPMKVSFVDTHLDLSSLKHLSKITIQNSRLTHVTINPPSLEKFWVYVKPELIQEIPPMKVSFTIAVKRVEFEEVRIVTAEQLVSFLNCSEPIQGTDRTTGGIDEMPFGLHTSEINFSKCYVLGSTVEKVESAIDCLQQVWEIKKFEIQTTASNISSGTADLVEDITCRNPVVLNVLQLKPKRDT
ncbi:uncharacterized protein LOC128237897 [Mya arenaria]|uniref:uncharacterized protein LOC128237897 n=1 Tax=Mya arenaria TaxID=6604 RepID=UPI0022E2540B|nr:uncharacterized protein LOC128237897 [Mya arenaria]